MPQRFSRTIRWKRSKKTRNLPSVCFLHIPKTGGSTLRESISKFAPFFGQHREHTFHRRQMQDFKNVLFVTALREPLERWISNLNYCLIEKISKHSFPRRFFEEENSLDNVLERCLAEEVNVNTMTKMLAGIEGSYKPHRCDTRKFSSDAMEEVLDIAKNNLQKMDLIGFISSLESFYIEIMKALKMPNTWSCVQNKNVNLNKRFHFSEFNLELLQKLNEYDIRLYKFAQDNYGGKPSIQ